MPKESKNDNMLNPKIWRHLVNFWTLVLYASVLLDFFLKNEIVPVIGPICAIYVALLAIYTAEKEFERWHDYHKGRHPGEVYVFVWTVIIILLLLLEILSKGSYQMPSEVFTTYIVVVGILAITKKSKSNYKRNKKR